MDFKNSDIATGSVLTNLIGADASASLEGAALLQLAIQAGNIMPLTADGQLVLPAGVGIDDIRVIGRDLIIQMPDGTQMIVPDGAIIVPQIVVDGVAIPALNIAALLVGQEPQPAAGSPQSSGGNFADEVGDIGDPFGLGDLLPPTALAFPEPELREVVPGLTDRDPDVVIQDGGPAGRDVTDNVSETGLPGTRANGNVEAPGSSAGNGTDATIGTILVTSPDGIASITINDVTVTGVAGQQIITPRGVLTLGALNGDQITYSYRLTDNTSGEATNDVFVVTVTDPDGDAATARLTINIADDVPTARNDTDSVAGGTFGPELGNVLSGAGTTSGATGADTPGADGAIISGFRAGISGNFATVGTAINGQYGTLTLAADGNYAYVRNVNTPGGVSDVFAYQLSDSDGDTSTATLTINIGDAPNRITFVPDIGDGTTVREPHLPSRGNEPSGSQFDGNPETTGGTITFNSSDGVGSVTVSGVVVNPAALPQVVSLNTTGTLVVTGYNYNPVTGVGSITYVYTLNDNTLNTDGESVSFPVVVTDLDGDVANDDLVIAIVDDAPFATNDSGTQQNENSAVAVNIFVNDTPGADGVNLTNGIAVVAGSLSGAGGLVYNNNGSFSYTPAPGEEGVVTFQYTITDGDGDTSTATVTITLLEDSIPQVDVAGGNVVDEAGLPAGSNAVTNSETTTGTIAVLTGGDTLASLVINNVNVTTGGTVQGVSGTLTVSVSDGAYSYSYMLTDNTSGDRTTESFNIVLTDSDGDSANDILVIAIQDDAPIAVNDSDTLAAGTYGPATGNVITDAEGDGGVDTQGADGAIVTAVSGSTAGSVGGATNGVHGVLTLNSDGSYSYARNVGTSGGVSDIFTYTLTDGDGDTSTATLTIRIANSLIMLDVPTKGEAGTLVDEAGLAGGSDAASNREATSGIIAYTAPDAPASVTIDGVAVTAVNQTFNGSFGTLTVTSIVNGAIGYSYILNTNTAGEATFDDFAVIVTDQDGDADPGTLVIGIVDDVPTARADVDSVTEDGPTTADGNVITGANVADANNTDGVADTQGADGTSVTAIAFGATNGTVGSALAGTYGSLTLNANGSYSYALNNGNPVVQGLDGNDMLTEVFTYTITDGDGDLSTATLTVMINGSDDPITINGLNAGAPDLIVDEDDLSDGSSPDSAALTQSGSFTINGVDGIASIKIGGTETSIGQSFANAFGTFTITSISAPINGSATAITLGYKYELTDNSAHTNANGQNFITELFDVEVTDTDGSTDTDQVEVRIVDDVPTAVNDSDTAVGGSNAPAVGNVITDLENDGGKDTMGADGVAVTAITGVAAGTVGGTTNGTYGVLTLNADGGYSYARNDGTPGNVQDVFTYQITDADGDVSTATLTIVIEDERPIVGPNAVVLLDDDALAGGNFGGTGDDVDAANVTGTLSGSGGDGALTFAFQTTAAPSGFSYVAGPAGSVLVQQGTTTVLTVTLNSATGAYTVTQNAPIIHASGSDENNAPFTLNYALTDVDGDTTNGTLTINVDDDTPTASAEPAQSVAEGGAINGAVEFSGGADGASVTQVNGTMLNFGGDGYSQSVDIGNGSIKVKADGTYVFTADNPVIGTGSANATFTITDTDGDPITATASFTITDVNTPTGGTTAASLDDDGLGGNAASNVDDLAVPNVDGDNNEATFAGTLTHGFGLDGAGTVSLAALGGTTGTVGTESVNYAWSVTAGVGTLTATGPRGLLFTLDVTLSTGAYELVLNDNVPHATGPNQENAVDPVTSLAYVVTDADGSPANGTLNITFDDDAPSLTVSGPETVIEGTSIVDGTWSQVIGADQPAATTEVLVGANSFALGTPINTGSGTLTVFENGTWTFAALNNLDSDLSPSVSFTVKVTDADGDTAQDTQTVAITDGPPADDADPVTLNLNEAALNTADAVGSNPSLTTETDNTPSLSFTAGSDALTSFQFSANLSGLISNLDGAGADIVWVRAGDGQSVVGHLGSAVGPVAVTLTLSAPASIAAGATGTVTVTATLSDNLPHSNALLAQVQSLGSILVEARDHDGDVATGQITINVQDDVSTANDDADTIDESQASALGNVLTGAGTTNSPDSVDIPGADAAVVTGAVAGDVAGPVANGGLGGGLVGSFGTLALDANGGYTYTLNNANPAVQALGVGDTEFETFTYTITDTDGDKSTATLTITINGTNDLPTFDAVTASVSEEGFGNGLADDNFAPDDTTNSLTAGGSINLADVDATDNLVVTLGTPAGSIAADGVPLTWVLAPDGKTLTGNAGPTAIIQVTINNTGTYGVTLLQPVDHLTANGENASTFTVPISVFDGTSTVTDSTGLTVRVEDDSPLAQPNTNTIVEGAIAVGNVLTNDQFGADGATTTVPAGGVIGVRAAGGNFASAVSTGTFTPIAGAYGTLTLNADGSYSYDGNPNAISSPESDVFIYSIRDADGDVSTTRLTINLTPITLAADNELVVVNEAGLDLVNDAGPDTDAGTVDGSTPTSNSDVQQGTLLVPGATSFAVIGSSTGSYGTLALNSNGTYTYTLTKPFDTAPDTNNGVTTETGKDVFNYTATDANGNSVNGTITVDIIDDVPTATATAVPGTIASLDETATTSTAATLNVANIGNDPDVAGTGRISFATTASAVVTAGGVYGADGANGNDPLVYALTATNAVSGLFVTDDAAINLIKEGDIIVGRVASGTFVGQAAFAIAINASSGVVTVEQYLSLKHPINPNPDDLVSLVPGSLEVTVTRTDGDGDKTTSTAADISGQIRFDDDGPTTFTPQTAVLNNVAGTPQTFSLDAGLGDGQMANNFGADGPGTVRFKAAIDGTDSGLKSGGQPIIYDIDNNDPTILYGKVGGSVIFTINLDPANSNYTVDLDAKVDSLVNVQFTDAGYDFVGGNKAWFGIVPNGQVGTPVNDSSQDVLITPLGGNSVNTSGILGGIAEGQSVGVSEGFRIDYVLDLLGSPPNDYVQGNPNGHSFDSHWVGGTNGASVSFRQSNGTDLRFQAFDDPDGNNVLGDGGLDTITGIVITYNGAASSILVPTSAVQNVTLSGRQFTYKYEADGKSVVITNIGGGNGNSGPPDTTVSVFTASGYNALEIEYVNGADIKFSGFGAAVQSGNPVNFQVPVEIVDGDGDAVDGTNLSVTLNPVLAPVAVDLDGDGAEFLSMTSGVTFDYAGNGASETTAWVGADDGLLALDRNGDGIVNDGSEIVFARDGMTDLEGLAADFDSNADGVLDASDADFAKFGVWQDANSNGATDAGEYRSLSDAGIVSINLVSDGMAYTAANGDVSVAGQSLYTKADGSTGIVADAAFATGGAPSGASRSSEQIRTSNVTSSVVAAALVGLAVEENLAAAPDSQAAKVADVVIECPVAANEVEAGPAASTSALTPLASSSEQDFAQKTSDVANSYRAADDGDDVKSFPDAPMSQRSDLLEDSSTPVSGNQQGSAFAFGGGDQVMHSMLDIAAFTASGVVGDNAALPLPIEDAVREAMPDLMVDRLIDAFAADIATPANDQGGARDSDLLAGFLHQGIQAFQFAAMASNDISSSNQYDLATISH